MTAYVLLLWRYYNPDRAAMRAYTERVQPTMAAYGGRYRRGVAHRLEVLEGDWHPRALVIVEFPTYEQARAWYDSPEYAPLKAIRLANMRNDAILVDALADGQPNEARPQFSEEEFARLEAFLAEAERRGVPPDRFHPGEPLDTALAAAAAEPPAADALERMLALLPTLDAEGRRRVMARCQALDAAAGH